MRKKVHRQWIDSYTTRTYANTVKNTSQGKQHNKLFRIVFVEFANCVPTTRVIMIWQYNVIGTLEKSVLSDISVYRYCY